MNVILYILAKIFEKIPLIVRHWGESAIIRCTRMTSRILCCTVRCFIIICMLFFIWILICRRFRIFVNPLIFLYWLRLICFKYILPITWNRLGEYVIFGNRGSLVEVELEWQIWIIICRSCDGRCKNLHSNDKLIRFCAIKCYTKEVYLLFKLNSNHYLKLINS